MLATYDAKEHSIIIGTRPITGYEDGTFITVRRRSDMFTLKIGADGKGIRSKSNDRSGEIEIVLMQGSEDNEYLSELALADELSNGGVRPFLLKDNLGTSKYAAEKVWIQKQPDGAHAKEAGARTWLFVTNDLSMFTGKHNEN